MQLKKRKNTKKWHMSMTQEITEAVIEATQVAKMAVKEVGSLIKSRRVVQVLPGANGPTLKQPALN